MLSWLPENISTYGGDIDSLMYHIYYITGVWFFLTYGVIIVFLLRYRRQEGQKAAYVRGDSLTQAGWLLVPLLIVLALDLWIDFQGSEVWAKIKIDAPSSDLLVGVTGKQFNWEIAYPGPDGKLGTADDLEMENELHVPVNKVVHVVLRSKDVIHSFFLPNLRLKQDVMPGRTIEAWFEATKPGRYPLPCAELCGFGHSGMEGSLIVHSLDEYEKWVQKNWPHKP
ncbi:MAG TPA: cytochrome c oxidase subunit II [Candidatus Limnocylindrales bacterium]|nr:cytochrome c oxidase subunit II [Candidatus Limnocylindrales bacterium]